MYKVIKPNGNIMLYGTPKEIFEYERLNMERETQVTLLMADVSKSLEASAPKRALFEGIFASKTLLDEEDE